MTLFHGKRKILVKLSEAERRVLRHGVTPGCPMCEEGKKSLEEKGYTLPSDWQGAVLNPQKESS